MSRFSHMPYFLTKTFVLIFAVGAALTCGIPFAAMATEGDVAPKYNTRSPAPAKPSRPINIFLPNATTRASQTPFSRYQSKQTSNAANSKETENSASPPAPALFLSEETRPTTSLMIGWLPAKEDMKTTGLYQPGPHQYASTKTEADCRTVDRTSNAVETPDGGSKGLHLPAGWLLGMCLHY